MKDKQRQAEVIAALEAALAELDDMDLNMPAIWVAQALATLNNEPVAREKLSGDDSSLFGFEGEHLTNTANEHIQK